jgi:hypothetical protein
LKKAPRKRRTTIKTNCATTGIGSLPHKNPDQALDYVIKTCPEIPYWPQLPQRSIKESMIYQFASGLPGLDESGCSIDTRGPDLGDEIERFYMELNEKSKELGLIPGDCASGLKAFIENGSLFKSSAAVKGHVTGPVSFGLSLVDENNRYIIYNDLFRDLYTKYLSVKAKYMESELQKVNKDVIIFFDEPLLYTYGSAYFNLSREVLVNMLKEVLDGVSCITGMHACHNCDWSILYEVSPDVISFDAYSYLNKFLLYTGELKDFIEKGGIVAWGIVPTTDEKYLSETAESLNQKMDELLDHLENNDFDVKKTLQQSLITPADGVGTLSLGHAHRVFDLNTAVSNHLKAKLKKY